MKNIIYFPNKILYQKCYKVPIPIDSEALKIIKELKFAIKNVKGNYEKTSLGLSANQIGYTKQIILISRYPTNSKLRKVFFQSLINPEIIESSNEKTIKWEGCLSEPELIALIERPKIIKLKYFNEKSEEKIEELSEVKSRIVQHEIEHLEGISFMEKKNDIIKTENLNALCKNDELYENWYDEQVKFKYLL